MTSFKQFIRQHKTRGESHGGNLVGSPAGPSQFGLDYMTDELNDDGGKNMPTIKSFDDLYDHMKSCGACSEAIEGALDTWRDFIRWQIGEGEFTTKSDRAFSRKLRRDYANRSESAS
jgi:hypothetical protein